MSTTTKTEAPRFLALKWTVSRARDTHGYNVVTLTDTSTDRSFRAIGGGYDMEGTVFAEWLGGFVVTVAAAASEGGAA